MVVLGPQSAIDLNTDW